MPPPTAPSPRALDAERRLRELLAEGDLPAPDEVRHDAGEVLFLFHEHKLAVVIDLEEEKAEPATPDSSPDSETGRPQPTTE